MSVDTIVITDDEESVLDTLVREGKLETLVSFVIFAISTLILVSITICVLCYYSKKKPMRKQISFDAYVYIDLTAKTEMRVAAMQAAVVDVQRNGYKPKVI